ncbi:hypothetical protein [Helicobacter sp. T3_23-1056]
MTLFCDFVDIDCHENPSGFSRNDGIPYWAKYCTNFRNDGKDSPSLCGGGLRGWVF